jgi:MFS family permease
MNPPSLPPASLRGPLSSSNFRLLAASNAISLAGSAVSFVALPFAVLRIGGTASDLGYVATAELISVAAVLLAGGVAADRLPRHQVIAAAGLLQALAQGTAAALVLTGQAHVWQLAALAAVSGAGFGFYYPARQGLLPQTVPASQRQQANALDRAARNAATIGGSALGGLLVSTAGPGWGLAIDAATFLTAAVLRAGMRFPHQPRAPAQAHHLLTDLREGWHEFTSRRWLWITVTQFTVITAISAATVNVLGPLVTHDHLGGARSWGYIIAAYSAGAVAGGLAMIRFQPHRILAAATLSLPAFSLLLFALAVPLTIPLDIAAATVAGGCVEVFSVGWATAMQQEIPPDRLSRVSSYDALGSYALTPAATAITGPLVTALGTRALLSASGVLTAILPALTLLVPDIRHLRRS